MGTVAEVFGQFDDAGKLTAFQNRDVGGTAVVVGGGSRKNRAGRSQPRSYGYLLRGNNSAWFQAVLGEAEANWITASICIDNVQDGFVASEWRFALAPTESVSNTDFRPVANGVVNNAAASASNPYGWYFGDFTGSTIIGTGAANSWSSMLSLPVAFPCLPRADGGTRPAYILRVDKTGAAGYIGVDQSPPVDGSTAALPWQRVFKRRHTQNAAGVANLALIPQSADSVNAFSISVQFQYERETRLLVTLGDSTLQNYGETNYVAKAVRTLSTPSAPFDLINLARGGQGPAEFMPRFASYLASGGAVPTDLYMPCASTNMSTLSVFDYMSLMNPLMMGVIGAARSAGVARVHVGDSFPYDVYGSDRSGALNAQRAFWKRQAANGVVDTFIEYTDLVGNGAMPERWKVGLSDDGQHPNQPGSDIVVPRFVRALAL